MDNRKTPQGGTPNKSGTSEDEKRRARFARALTRSVFGRHYWNDEMDREMREFAARKPRPPK